MWTLLNLEGGAAALVDEVVGLDLEDEVVAVMWSPGAVRCHFRMRAPVIVGGRFGMEMR